MNLTDIESILKDSDACDWERVNAPVSQPGHSGSAVYKPDLRLSLEWGVAENHDYKEAWANRHPDPSARSYYADVLFAGAVVKRVLMVAIDGGRAHIPAPSIKSDAGMSLRPDAILRFTLGRDDYEFGMLLAGVNGDDDAYLEYIGRAGLGVENGRDADAYQHTKAGGWVVVD